MMALRSSRIDNRLDNRQGKMPAASYLNRPVYINPKKSMVFAALKAYSGIVDVYNYATRKWKSAVSWFYNRYFDGHVMALRCIDIQECTITTVYDAFHPIMFPRFIMFRALPWPVYNYGLFTNGDLKKDRVLYECILCHKGELLMGLFRGEEVYNWLDPLTNAIDHTRASECMFHSISMRHNVKSCMTNINGTDVTHMIGKISSSLAADTGVTAVELHRYLVARYGLQPMEDGEVRIDIMDMDSLEQTSLSGSDVVSLVDRG